MWRSGRLSRSFAANVGVSIPLRAGAIVGNLGLPHDPSRDRPPRPGHHQSQLNSYRSQRARWCTRGGIRENQTPPASWARPLAQFRQFAVLAVAWLLATGRLNADARIDHGTPR
jgi:hypothetical protein